MKIIDILNKIANGEEPPKEIIFKCTRYEYVEQEKDYVNEVFGNDWIFDSHIVTDIINDEVEILEPTITYKPTYAVIDNKKYLVKYKNGETLYEYIEDYKPDKIEKLNLKVDTWCNPSQCDLALGKKIDEIIDRFNN